MPLQFSSDPILQAYAQAAATTNVQRVADFLAPTVEVAVMSGRYWIHDKTTPLRIPDTRRGIGGRATIVNFADAKGSYDCTPHALDTPLDELEINEANQNGYANIIQERADVISYMGGLSHEKQVVDLAMTALGAGTAVSWVNANDPVKTINAYAFNIMKSTLGGSSMELRILMGADAWRQLSTHPLLVSRLPRGSQTKGGVQSVSLADFGNMLAVNMETRVSLGVFDDADEGQSADMQWILGNQFVIFAASQSPNRMDPSFMKTFRLRGYWMKLGEYQRDDERATMVKFDWSSDPRVTNAGAAIRLNPTFTA